MTILLDNTLAATRPSKELKRTTAAAPQAAAKPSPAATRDSLRTLLVASCGWPSDATPPLRRRATKR